MHRYIRSSRETQAAPGLRGVVDPEWAGEQDLALGLFPGLSVRLFLRAGLPEDDLARGGGAVLLGAAGSWVRSGHEDGDVVGGVAGAGQGGRGWPAWAISQLPAPRSQAAYRQVALVSASVTSAVI
jgi:hypothetical protein